MRYTLAAAALAAGASAHYNAYNQTTEAPVYTTEVVTAYTTYCPGATEVSHNGVTYTITEVRCGEPIDPAIRISANARLAGHHLDHHQLPVHGHQARLLLSCHVLLHLVPPLQCPQYVGSYD